MAPKMTNDFIEWLSNELERRYWTYNELARRADLSSATISLVMTGRRGVGKDFCNGIARAFDIPPVEVFRRAGLLPPAPEPDRRTESMLYLFRRLPVEDQERLLAMMRGLTTIQDIKGKDKDKEE